MRVGGLHEERRTQFDPVQFVWEAGFYRLQRTERYWHERLGVMDDPIAYARAQIGDRPSRAPVALPNFIRCSHLLHSAIELGIWQQVKAYRMLLAEVWKLYRHADRNIGRCRPITLSPTYDRAIFYSGFSLLTRLRGLKLTGDLVKRATSAILARLSELNGIRQREEAIGHTIHLIAAYPPNSLIPEDLPAWHLVKRFRGWAHYRGDIGTSLVALLDRPWSPSVRSRATEHLGLLFEGLTDWGGTHGRYDIHYDTAMAVLLILAKLQGRSVGIDRLIPLLAGY